MQISIIGAGISGLSLARMLQPTHNVTVYEKKSTPGGLIRCQRINGNLFHQVGGHVFNSKNQEVLDWFWQFFNQDTEFVKTKRKAKIGLDEQFLGYPIENSIHKLKTETVKTIVHELLELQTKGYVDPFSHPHFEAFLLQNFGETLYNLYFKPYNEKLWKRNLNTIPLHWLEGKLPMPRYEDIFLSNILQEEESNMVHSTFYYARRGGSQFIIDRLAEGLKIETNTTVDFILPQKLKADKVIYTGDVRQIPNLGIDLPETLQQELSSLQSNSTSNMLCYTDETDISWLYLPDPKLLAHRIIYTGNFSNSNNAGQRKTCVVEFSGDIPDNVMKKEIKKLPGNLEPIAINHEPNSYIIHDHSTSALINEVKQYLEPLGIYLLGRFAEWEYYNMDKCMEAAMQLKHKFMR